MNNTSIDIALRSIEESRSELLDIVNKNMDALKQRVLDGEIAGDLDGQIGHEYEYSLNTPPALFKGTKPTAVIFDSDRVPVNTWRKAYIEILKRCASEQANHDALMNLRNRISGRKRTILSDKPTEMNVPVMLSGGLYAEAYFDTEWLIRILTRQILDAIHYDYSRISVAVIIRRRGR